MASRLTEVIIDCTNLDREVEFWTVALGYEQANRGDGWVALRPRGPEPTDPMLSAAAQAPGVALVVVPELKAVKNRVHIDMTPVDRPQAAEVARLEALGARQIDIGQGEAPWVVMADPEGNEFCIMSEIEIEPS